MADSEVLSPLPDRDPGTPASPSAPPQTMDEDTPDPDSRKSPSRSPSRATLKRTSVSMAPEDDIEAKAKKVRQSLKDDQEVRKRGRRMFGVLMGTLNKFKEEGSKSGQSEAAQRRASLESRLADKLRTEQLETEKKRKLDQEEKSLKLNVTRKEEELLNMEQFITTRHAMQRKLCKYLCTKVPQSSANSATAPSSTLSTPHVLTPNRTSPTTPAPLYYLPYKLLPSQEDQLDLQQDEISKQLEKEESEWEEEKKTREEELEELKRERRVGLARVERERGDLEDARNGGGGRARERERDGEDETMRERDEDEDRDREVERRREREEEDEKMEEDDRSAEKKAEVNKEKARNGDEDTKMDASEPAPNAGDEDAVEY